MKDDYHQITKWKTPGTIVFLNKGKIKYYDWCRKLIRHIGKKVATLRRKNGYIAVFRRGKPLS